MPAIQATEKLKDILKDYYLGFFPEQGSKPKVAWCTSVGPAELLQSLGFTVYYPENHGAMLGASRKSAEFIPVATARGYSPDICSYLTSDVGSYLRKSSPLTKAYGIPSPPKPDVLVYNTNQCREVQDWFGFYAREFNVPAFGVFSPWKVDELKKSHITGVENQLKELVPQLESVAQEKFDIDKLREVIRLSSKTSELWKKFLETAKAHPSPINFFDSCIQMAPAVVLRGTQVAVDYYTLLNQEMDQWVKDKVSAVNKEKARIYWDGMPIWGKLRFFSELFNRINANVVASTYCNSWIFDAFDPKEPFYSMAEAYTQIFINRSEKKKEELLISTMREYEVNGIVFHDAKTCPYNSNSRFGLPQRVSRASGVSHLVIDGDLNDLRCFSEEQTVTSLETFMEQLKGA